MAGKFPWACKQGVVMIQTFRLRGWAVGLSSLDVMACCLGLIWVGRW